MRFQIGLIVLAVVAIDLVFYACFRRAMRELHSGDARIGLACLLVSVFGFVLSIVGGYLAISLLLEQDLRLARLGDYPGSAGCKRIAAAYDRLASVGRNAKRQDAAERLGPKDEHAVDSEAGETPQ